MSSCHQWRLKLGLALIDVGVNYKLVQIPETLYTTTSDGVSIAYQVIGSGPPDVVYVGTGYTANVDLVWEWALLWGPSSEVSLSVDD